MNSSPYPDYDYVFGQLMLTLRNKIGLTQTGLGDALGVSRRTIGSWESGRKYPNVDNLMVFIELAVEQEAFPMGREEDEIRSLWKLARQKVLLDERWLANLLTAQKPLHPQNTQSIPIRYPSDTPPSTILNLPFQPTSFVGRTDELHEIASTLGDSACRLLTLIGPGGIGKTRLAIETAMNQQSNFSDGVVFVSLAPINAPNQIVPAICESLHLNFGGTADILEQLIRYLKQREMLLILDNFEHVLDGADIVNTITHQTNHLTILVTSRVSLDLRVEWLYDVEGLRYPAGRAGADLPSSDDLNRYPAIQLFAQRALQIQPGFALSDTSLPTIVSLCQSVAGMPLGIELAVAGLRTHSIDAIEQQIRSSIASLSTTLRDIPSRHRSMRAVFDHSWNLLNDLESTLFRYVAVFRGSFTAHAVEHITGAKPFRLKELVDKSLIQQIDDNDSLTYDAESRFNLLVPIREYAWEKLDASGELASLQRAHAEYYVQLAASAAEQWDSPTSIEGIEVFTDEQDNMNVALQWAYDNQESILGLKLSWALTRLWRMRGNITEGREWLAKFLTMRNEEQHENSIRVRMRALHGAAMLATDQHDFIEAQELFAQSANLRRILGQSDDETTLLINVALQARANGNYQQSTALLEEVLSQHRASGNRGSLGTGGFGFALYLLALVLREQGDFDRATAIFQECAQFHLDIGEQEGVAQALLGLSDIARDRGNITLLYYYCDECLQIFRKFGTQWAIGYTLHNLAVGAFVEGNNARALELANDSLAVFRSINNDGGMAEVRITLGNILLAQGDTVGAYHHLNDALQLALTVGSRLLVASGVEGLAGVLAQTQYSNRAVQLLSIVQSLRTQMGTPLRPVDQPGVEQILNITRASLGNEAFEKRWIEAQSFSFDEALSMILNDVPYQIATPSSQASIQPESIDEKPVSVSNSNSDVAKQRLDWDDAISVPSFYGRDWETNLLHDWIIHDQCRVVTLLGLGGIGKSTLAVHVMRQLADQFEVVIWRSLRDVSECTSLLVDLLQVLDPDSLKDKISSTEQRLNLLCDQLRAQKVLLVIDNVETALGHGEQAGQMTAGYEAFARFLQKVAEVNHRSCIILTSREKPNVLIQHEGRQATVRTLRLSPLDIQACERLLMNRGIRGTSAERNRLVEAYTGNPLALKIVAQTILDLFDGEPAPFLQQGEVIFGGIRDLLRVQFDRLSELEYTVVVWLAIFREPATLDDIHSVLATPIPRSRLFEAIDYLQRRSLLERGQQAGSFTLQSVLLEYITGRIVIEAGNEILSGDLNYLLKYGLELAQTPEYLRQLKLQQLIQPILEHLQGTLSQSNMLEQHLVSILSALATKPASAQGYAPANILALLHALRGHLRHLDLSHLMIRGAYLQGADLRDSSFAEAIFASTVFTETFDAITAIAVDKSGRFWAGACTRGEIRLWTADGTTLNRMWQAHGDMIWTLEFSPDGQTLASSGWDSLIKLWDVTSGKLLWSGQHGSHINDIAFSPDGRLLASSGTDGNVKLWDLMTTRLIQTFRHLSPVTAVIWHPDGHMIVTADLNGDIRLFAFDDDHRELLLEIDAHNNWIDGLAISPDGKTLASASWDATVKLWRIPDGQLMHNLTGHTDQVNRVCWSTDGRTLASSSRDQTIWIWDVEHSNYRAMLQGHTSTIKSLTFLPDSSNLLSGSFDGSLRLWDVRTSRCMSVVRGYANTPTAIDWSSDSHQLVSGNIDTTVTIYDADTGNLSQELRGHIGVVIGVSWNARQPWVASTEWDNLIKVWDVNTGKNIHTLRHPDGEGIFLHGIAWSPDGTRLACGTNSRGIHVFNMDATPSNWDTRDFATWIRPVAWSPDGHFLAGGGDDGTVYIWNPENGRLHQELAGHRSMVTSLAWSPNRTRLATGGTGADGGELLIWDTHEWRLVNRLDSSANVISAVAWGDEEDIVVTGDNSGSLSWWNIQFGQLIHSHNAHQGAVQSLKQSPDGKLLASCGDDGAVVVWDSDTGHLLRTFRHDRPYERVNIRGIKGLTDAQKATLRTLGATE